MFFALFILSACSSSDTTAPAVCGANEDFAGDGTCLPYLTSEECQSLGFNGVDRRGDCIPFTQAECAYFFTDGKCLNLHTARALSHFDTEEYRASNTLENVRAAQAYVNIENLLATDLSGTVTQGGGRQTVSVVANGEFATTHQEFTRGEEEAAPFDFIYDASGTGTLYTGADITDSSKGNCPSNSCTSTKYAALVVGSKDDADNGMHGIAYNARLRGIVIPSSASAAELENVVARGTGANIIAMNHVWVRTATDGKGCVGTFTYTRPGGKGILENGACGDAIVDSPALPAAELKVWEDAVSNNNKTIMVFGAGYYGFNSETNAFGLNVAGGDLLKANIPEYYAAYPVLFDDDKIEAEKWLVVVGLDENNKALSSANGCGYALHFCLAAPSQNIYTASQSRDKADASYAAYQNIAAETYNATATVAGGLAVLKGAFPKATSEQLTKLVLETATYIPLDNKTVCTSGLGDCPASGFKAFTDPDGKGRTEDDVYKTEVTNIDGTKRFINLVYGYGLLNLDAATKPSVRGSYVTASNNNSIGALWADTKLTLSSHFGGNFESLSFGIGDAYGRHFVTPAPQVNHTPVAVGLDDYMAGLLGDNVQSERLGPQARANYSNSEQSWMNLQYTSGKATSKISFQESYKLKPLNDNSASAILRANHIRPASQNIGMMDVDYQLGQNLTLSSYAARGEYDTGYRFDELGTDIDVRHKKSSLNIGIGNLREHQQFLGTNTTGAYALSAPTVSRFTDVTYGHDVGGKFNIYANYIQYKTDVNMGYSQFATIGNLQADQYQIGFKGKNLISDDDNLNIALITKLGVTDGALNQNTVRGYTADGGYNNVSQSYDLAVPERHQQFEITYQGRLYQNADKVSALKDNRFFTTIRVDQNLNHVQGASQTEIVSGINARF